LRTSLSGRDQFCYHIATICFRGDIIEAVHGRLVPHREPLAVGVHGELDAGVAELALDIDRALALLQQERGEGVARQAWREVQGQAAWRA
jgi:hypothetical protein